MQATDTTGRDQTAKKAKRHGFKMTRHIHVTLNDFDDVAVQLFNGHKHVETCVITNIAQYRMLASMATVVTLSSTIEDPRQFTRKRKAIALCEMISFGEGTK